MTFWERAIMRHLQMRGVGSPVAVGWLQRWSQIKDAREFEGAVDSLVVQGLIRWHVPTYELAITEAGDAILIEDRNDSGRGG